MRFPFIIGLILVVNLLAGCFLYQPPPEPYAPTGEIKAALEGWFDEWFGIPEGTVEISTQAVDRNSPGRNLGSFIVSENRTVAVQDYLVTHSSISCVFGTCPTSPAVRYFDLQSPYWFEVVRDKNPIMIRDYTEPNPISWFFGVESFSIVERTGEFDREVTGVTSNGGVFRADFIKNTYTGDLIFEPVVFELPGVRPFKIEGRPELVDREIRFPDTANASRSPVALPDLRYSRDGEPVTIHRLVNSVSPDEIEVRCEPFAGRARDNASLAIGFPDSDRPCFFEWIDVDGSGLLSAGDQFVFQSSDHYLGFYDLWADQPAKRSLR